MRRASLRALPLAPVLLLLTHCGRDPAPTAARASAVATFTSHGAEVASLIARAGGAPRASARGLAIATRGLLGEIDDRGAIALHGATSLAFRVEGVRGAPRVEDRVAVIDGEAETLIFDRGAALELLHRLPRRAPLSYAIELPVGASLRRIEDGAGGTVEVLDAAAVPRARLTADAAWDRHGHRLSVSLRLSADGRRVAIELPDDAAYPVVVDPAWSATTQPVRLRSNHTATLLGNGDVLIAGGGSATAEVFELTTGRFRPVGSMTISRKDHSAVQLPDGTVLIAGGDAGNTTEIYDPGAATFTAGPPTSSLTGWIHLTRLTSGAVLANGLSSAERFDPVARTWTTLPVSPGPGSTAVLANGDVLFMASPTAQLYRTATDTFEAIPLPVGVLPADHVSALHSGGALVYAVTGVGMVGGGGLSYTLGTWSFDATTRAFTRRPDVSHPAFGPGLTLPSGKVLYVGARAQTYDPATNAWSAADVLPTDHGAATATLLPTGGVLIVGGNAGAASLYAGGDPTGPIGSVASGNLSIGHVGAGLTRLLDGRALLAGGEPPKGVAGDGRKTAEIWSPTTGAWTKIDLQAARVGHAQALLRSGKVLIAGGGALSSAELFDPATNATSATGSLSIARDGAAMTLLPSGKVLVTGGSTTAPSAELFDESSGAFTVLSAAMVSPHQGHGAVLLPSGKVILIDGTSSELFDPVTERFTKGPALSAPRDGRTASVLPDGGLVLAGKSLTLPLERYVAASNTFALAGVMTSRRLGMTAASLPFGRVLFGFGTDDAGYETSADTWIFDPLAEAGRGTTVPKTVNWGGREARVVQLASGALLAAGGDGCAAKCIGSPSIDTRILEPLAPAMSARPTITKVPTTIVSGAPFDVEGARLVGNRESDTVSSTRLPIFVFVPASGQGSVIATTLSFTDTTARVRLPATALRGKGFLHAAVAGVTGPGALVDVGAAANGTTCAVGADCDSGFCVDGVCCDGACQGVCLACTKARKGSGADGVCGAIPPEKEPNDACAAYQGAACAADAQCASGVCADGVCCDARCDGQCESCRVEGSFGTCVPVVGAPATGHAACDAGTSACDARQCDGKARATCAGFAPSTTGCRVAGCAGGVATIAASCDGLGACPAAVTKPCEPFACGDAECLTRCTADSECTSGYRCAAGKCVTGAYCAGDHLLQTPGAADVDCSPYLCEGDHCKTTCASSSECSGGFLCSDGACVVASTSDPAAASDGGCAAPRSASGGRLDVGALGLGALGLAGLLARRRRRRA